jgi:hypothetical protein
VTYHNESDYKEAFQILGDLYLWQSVASIVGLYVKATRLSPNVQQIFMYGNKYKGNYGPLLVCLLPTYQCTFIPVWCK